MFAQIKEQTDEEGMPTPDQAQPIIDTDTDCMSFCFHTDFHSLFVNFIA